MLVLLLLCGVSCFVTVNGLGLMGPGMWTVHYVDKCEDPNHKFKFELTQEKINRTHDGFNAYALLEADATDEYAIRIDVCKYVDGGCKPYQVFYDHSFSNFVHRFAANNLRRALAMAGIDPPDFPIPKGEYRVDGYVFDYTELPPVGPYGEFQARCCALKDERELGCIIAQAEFREHKDGESPGILPLSQRLFRI